MANSRINLGGGSVNQPGLTGPGQEMPSQWGVIDHCNTAYVIDQEDRFDGSQALVDPLKESLYEADQLIDYDEGNMPMWGTLYEQRKDES